MNADDRILLLDLENLGTVRLRPRPLRARLEALLAIAGDIHHAIAAYALPADGTDPVASLLAELRIAPLRVPPGPDAAELALLAHARYVHAEGGRSSSSAARTAASPSWPASAGWNCWSGMGSRWPPSSPTSFTTSTAWPAHWHADRGHRRARPPRP